VDMLPDVLWLWCMCWVNQGMYTSKIMYHVCIMLHSAISMFPLFTDNDSINSFAMEPIYKGEEVFIAGTLKELHSGILTYC